MRALEYHDLFHSSFDKFAADFGSNATSAACDDDMLVDDDSEPEEAGEAKSHLPFAPPAAASKGDSAPASSPAAGKATVAALEHMVLGKPKGPKKTVKNAPKKLKLMNIQLKLPLWLIQSQSNLLLLFKH